MHDVPPQFLQSFFTFALIQPLHVAYTPLLRLAPCVCVCVCVTRSSVRLGVIQKKATSSSLKGVQRISSEIPPQTKEQLNKPLITLSP